jgi:hypothetical protein
VVRQQLGCPKQNSTRHGPTAANPFKEGTAMISIRRTRTTCIALLATLVTALITAPNVLAQMKPHDPGGTISVPAQPPTPAAPAAVVSYGSSTWMFVLVALLVLLITAALLTSHRLRHSRHRRAAHA